MKNSVAKLTILLGAMFLMLMAYQSVAQASGLTLNLGSATIDSTTGAATVPATWEINSEYTYQSIEVKNIALDGDPVKYVVAVQNCVDSEDGLTQSCSFNIDALSQGATYEITLKSSEPGLPNLVSSTVEKAIPAATSTTLPSPVDPTATLLTTSTFETLQLSVTNGQTNVVGYYVSAEGNNTTKYYQFKKKPHATGTTSSSTTVDLTGLYPNTKYKVTIKSVDSYGRMSSGYISDRTTKRYNATKPTTPQVDGGAGESSSTYNSITVRWKASTVAKGHLAGYKVYYKEKSSTKSAILATTVAGDVTQYTITGLKEFTPYEIRVDAFDNSLNTVSSYKDIWTGTDDEAPSTPTGLTVTNEYASGVDIKWTPSTDNIGISGYRVEFYNTVSEENEILIGFMGSDIITTPFLGWSTATQMYPEYLKTGVKYEIRVYALDSAASTNVSEAAVIEYTLLPQIDKEMAPTVPGYFSLQKVNHNSAELKWEPSRDNGQIIRYDIYVKNQGGNIVSGFPVSYVPQSTRDTFYKKVITGLSTNTPYKVYIVAVDNTNSESGSSSEISFTTAQTPCEFNSSCTSYIVVESNVSNKFIKQKGSLNVKYNVYARPEGISYVEGILYYPNGNEVPNSKSYSLVKGDLSSSVFYKFAGLAATNPAGNYTLKLRVTNSNKVPLENAIGANISIPITFDIKAPAITSITTMDILSTGQSSDINFKVDEDSEVIISIMKRGTNKPIRNIKAVVKGGDILHTFKWDGLDLSGKVAQDATYVVMVTATDMTGNSIKTMTNTTKTYTPPLIKVDVSDPVVTNAVVSKAPYKVILASGPASSIIFKYTLSEAAKITIEVQNGSGEVILTIPASKSGSPMVTTSTATFSWNKRKGPLLTDTPAEAGNYNIVIKAEDQVGKITTHITPVSLVP